jgi:DNA-binding FadR family transcriptional regulator
MAPLTEPASAPLKADVVARDLMRQIVSGEVAVGSLLPREDELARRYRVNRSVIREAVKLLEVHRLVRPVRRRGTEVLSPLSSMSPEVLRALLAPSPGRVDPRVLAGLLEIRAALDVQMSGLAAERRSARDLAAMEAALARLAAARAAHDAPAYAAAVDELSLALARATGNPLFEMLAAWNRVVILDLEALFAFARAPSEPHEQALRTLVAAIRRRDVEGTRRMVASYHEYLVPRLTAAAKPFAETSNLERLR